MCFALMSASAAVTIALADDIASLYANDPEVVALASSLLLIAAILQLGDGTQVTAAGALRGVKDTRVPLLINGLVYWCIGFTVAYVLGVELGYGAKGVWLGLTCSLWIAAILLTRRFGKVMNTFLIAES
jgi:MATE family multidrug resistance protein